MNLEDYAVLDNGRWYVDPQVSLNEQNAFINNWRNVEAQNNAEIARQTRNLGTQVPSQLGGLVGGGSYFRARQQTPVTNQTIADLKATMQGKALELALNNLIQKYKKKYSDAENSGASGGDYLDRLEVNAIDSYGEGEKQLAESAGTETRIIDPSKIEKSHTADKDFDIRGAGIGAGIGGTAGVLTGGLPGLIIGGVSGGYTGGFLPYWSGGKLRLFPEKTITKSLE